MRIRYIRNSINGSNINSGCQWIEIQAIDYFDNNIALNKNVTASFIPSIGNLNLLTNNVINEDTLEYIGYKNEEKEQQYVEIDLGNLYNIKNIVMYHFHDNRTYKNNKLEVSKDSVNWITVFNSNIEGEYPSNLKGKNIKLKITEELDTLPIDSDLTTTKEVYEKILDTKKEEKYHFVDILKAKGVEVLENDKMSTLIDKSKDMKGFPTGWDVEESILVHGGNISEGDPVVSMRYGTFEEGISPHSAQPPKPKDYITYSLLSPDGKWLAQSESEWFYLYRFDGNSFVKKTSFLSSLPRAMGWSADSKTLVFSSGSPDLTVYRIDGENFKTVMIKSPISLGSVAISSDGTYIVGKAYVNESFRAWKYNSSSGEYVATQSSMPGVTNFSTRFFSPDDKYVYCSNYQDNSGPTIFKLVGDTFVKMPIVANWSTGLCTDISPSSDGVYVLTSSSASPVTRLLKRDGDSWKQVSTPVSPSGASHSCTFSSDGNYMIVGHEYGNKISIYRKEIDDTWTTLPLPPWGLLNPPDSFSITSDGNYLLALKKNDSNFSTRLYNLDSSLKVSKYSIPTVPIMHYPYKRLGVALETKGVGQLIKVNLFPKLTLE